MPNFDIISFFFGGFFVLVLYVLSVFYDYYKGIEKKRYDRECDEADQRLVDNIVFRLKDLLK